MLAAMKRTILLVEDEPKAVKVIRAYLEQSGFEVHSSFDGLQALSLFRQTQPDLVVLDLNLPGIDGLEVCRNLRQISNVPIIMLTARAEETDRLIGLELGADDYIVKPFSPRELVARVKAVLRRVEGASLQPQPRRLAAGAVEMDESRRQAWLRGQPLDLTTMEYQLLVLFASNPGRTFNRDEILNELRGIDAQLFSRSVDILVSRLRQKLGDTSRQPRFIKTVWGTGYAFVGVDPVAT